MIVRPTHRGLSLNKTIQKTANAHLLEQVYKLKCVTVLFLLKCHLSESRLVGL